MIESQEPAPSSARPEPTRLEYGKRIEEEAALWFKRTFPSADLKQANYRCKVGEIDLIFEEVMPDSHRELVFVEVRARGATSWESGVESVNFRKRRKLLLAIRHYLAQYRGEAVSARLDVLGWDGSAWQHVPNVWY